MNDKTYIVITTINSPNASIEKWESIDEGELIIVGDKKTPEPWVYQTCKYLGVDAQITSHYSLTKSLPYNHYCRKMLGYLEAISTGAEMILDTDDDNIPYLPYDFLDLQASRFVSANLGYINVYSYFTSHKVWPRGFPLELINEAAHQLHENMIEEGEMKVAVWQGLADQDPDVDAVYRLTDGRLIEFEKKENFALGKGTWSPFNSQNTLWVNRDFFPLLYLPVTVTFRFTDILRGYVALAIMHAKGKTLGITNATVFQERNPHDYLKDFESEIPVFLNAQKIMNLLCAENFEKYEVSDALFRSYELLIEHGLVDKNELMTLTAWLEDLRK